jgi:osmotically-inducible protein OsmY
MFRKEPITDAAVLKDVNKRLTRTGTGSRIKASVHGGQVTLTGEMQYENQRRSFVQAVNRAEGIKGIIDQMTVAPHKKR